MRHHIVGRISIAMEATEVVMSMAVQRATRTAPETETR